MPYGFIQDVPADRKMYEQIKALLPTEPPTGMVAHLVLEREGGLRYIDVWESEADWERFRVEQVEPAVGQVLASYGIPHTHDDVRVEQIQVVDTWLARTPAHANSSPEVVAAASKLR